MPSLITCGCSFCCPAECCWGCLGSRARASSVHCGSCSWCFLTPLLVHVGSEGQQKTCNFDPQSFVVMSYLGVPLWRAGEQMGVELSLQPGASGLGHRDFLYLRPIVPKDPFRFQKILLAIYGSFCTNKTTCTHPGRNWCCV